MPKSKVKGSCVPPIVQRTCVFELNQMVRKLIGRLEKSQLSPVEQDKFVIAFKESFAVITSKNDFNEVMEIYHVACRFIPSLHVHAGGLLARLGLIEEAMACFRCGVEAIPDDLSAISQLENACCTLVERWHFGMVNDLRRNACYRDAILSAIASNHNRVLDIGTGSGLLACYCSQGNAEKPVYACDDSTTMCAVASAVFSKNNLSSSDIKLIKMRSTELAVPRDIPHRVSLVVTEIFDAALFGEGVLKTLQHAWQELLLPPKTEGQATSASGLVIPRRASLYATAIECQKIRRENRLIAGGCYRHLSTAYSSYGALCRTNFLENYDVAESENVSEVSNSDDSLFESYTTERLNSIRGGYTALTEDFLLTNVNFNDPVQIDSLLNEDFHIKFELLVKSRGVLDAIIVFFDLDLSDETIRRSIGNRPNPSVHSCWEQAIFPVLPIHFELPSKEKLFLVQPGDVLAVEAHLNDDGRRLSVRCCDIIRSSPLGQGTANTEIEPPLNLPLSRSTIRYLNDSEYNFSLSRLLEYAFHAENCRTVLILSSTPSMLSIQAALIGYQRVVHVIPHPSDALVMSTLSSRVQASQKKMRSTPVFVAGPVEELVEESTSNSFDLVISEMVEPCGILRQQSVEELQLAKLMLLASPSLISPSQLRIYGMFIECDELFEHTTAVRGSNDGIDCATTCRCVRTCQVHVADFINLYRVRTNIDVDIHAMKYRALSEKFLIFDIDLDEQKVDASDETRQPGWLKSVIERDISVGTTGRLAALVFWFEIDLIDDLTAKRFADFDNVGSHMLNVDQSFFTINTLRASSHFRQSAVMVAEDRPLSVISGYVLKTRFVFHNSCLTFSFLSAGRSNNGLLL